MEGRGKQVPSGLLDLSPGVVGVEVLMWAPAWTWAIKSFLCLCSTTALTFASFILWGPLTAKTRCHLSTVPRKSDFNHLGERANSCHVLQARSAGVTLQNLHF